jgi:ABC-type multidrug transport system permease subunit
MSESGPEKTHIQQESSQNSGGKVSIIAIIATVIVMLACIASCTLLGYAFFSNPPW